LGTQILVQTGVERAAPGITFVDKARLLAKSDVISLHCPLTPETTDFIDRAALSAMKKGALLINVSRGPVVDSVAVSEALHADTLEGYAADVLEVEPPPQDHPLLKAPRCVLTPHIAWATEAARKRLIQETHDNVAAFWAGRRGIWSGRRRLPTRCEGRELAGRSPCAGTLADLPVLFRVGASGVTIGTICGWPWGAGTGRATP